MNKKHARRIALYSQGLLDKAPFGQGIDATKSAIEKIHYVQIDTISVVERAHHQVIRTRVPDYSPTMLHELQFERRSIFEYWAHAAAYLPMSDYRYYRPLMDAYAQKFSPDKKEKKIQKEILARITSEGPLQSRDFESPKGTKSNGWWDWKPAKRALEKLFLSGELMISERQGFQKVYDLTQNVLPENVDTSIPGEQERGHFYIRRMLMGLGVARARDIGYARAVVKRFSSINIQKRIDLSLEEMRESGELGMFTLNDSSYYYLTDILEKVPDKLGRRRITFLSPFDNLVINRNRLFEVFDYDYQLECYVPQKKRKFGYFTQPVLYGDELIGRIDCKADRKSKNLIINNLWLEEKTRLSEALISALVAALNKYKRALACDSIIVMDADNIRLRKLLLERYKTM